MATARPTAEPPPDSPIMHFSHPHELHPISIHRHQPAPPICAACRLRSGGAMLTCLPCAFAIHQSCAELPPLITHAAHGGCVLSLLTAAAYPGGAFSCDGCKRGGDGWSYHCGRCEYDLHVTCACRPLRIRVPEHGSCELHLVFRNPYAASNGFACDVCRKIGAKQWLYHCTACEFDAHLDCAAAPEPPPPQHAFLPPSHGGGINVGNAVSSIPPSPVSALPRHNSFPPAAGSAPPAVQQPQLAVSPYSVIRQFPARVPGSGFGSGPVNEPRRDARSGGFGDDLTAAAAEGSFEK
ncbi:uncharacterized protein LOC127263056 [Andrographis paniculata]|uniref:uncharacterized protein LOC127263056 n=1 Tax=Andrographis paniculata TaxID=175694 RepID=UPI0021E85FD7|nr:uncharacterized protein LOC127263056 [Andrographis paniculata]